MILPVQITFRNMPRSEAVAARVQEEAEKLDEFYKRITSCRVIVEVPHRHHVFGDQVHVRIELGVPGGEIVVRAAIPSRNENSLSMVAPDLIDVTEILQLNRRTNLAGYALWEIHPVMALNVVQ